MRLGCFGIVSDIETIAQAGFDFIEPNLQELVALSPAEFDQVKQRLLQAGLGADACSWILPRELDLTSEAFSLSDWQEYLETGAQRCRQLGTTLWPLGCGIGRGIKPENGDPDAQAARLCQVFSGIGRIIRPYGITLAIEPLGPRYSNHLNKIAQAAQAARNTGGDNIRTMCDLRHMMASQDPLAEIHAYRDLIAHAHIDYPLGEDRVFPQADDGFDYRVYLTAVAAEGIERLSVEPLQDSISENGAASARFLRSLLAEI